VAAEKGNKPITSDPFVVSCLRASQPAKRTVGSSFIDRLAQTRCRYSDLHNALDVKREPPWESWNLWDLLISATPSP
jgi:hypothetical protein